MSSRKRPAKKARIIKQEFDVDLTLLANRQLFIQEGIDDECAKRINKHLFALDTVNHRPIMIYIDSPGGYCSSGLSIINVMKTIKSPVVTIINSEACSMGGYIAIAGDKRSCYENCSFMAHDLETEFEGTSLKFKDRANYIEKYSDVLDKFLKNNTKLNKEDLIKAKNGELWLFSEEMLESGIIDEIILHNKK